MSEINGKYKQIIEDLENHIQDPKELEFVKGKFSDLSLVFIDIIDRLTSLTDARIKQIEEKQRELINKMGTIQSAVDGIESDIYEEDDNYEFEIVCPYCNYEFTTDIEDENRNEIQCPECHNTIELDWNQEEETRCSGSCSSCASHCGVEEDEEEYELEDNEELDSDEEITDNKYRRKYRKQEDDNKDDENDEDM